MKKRLAVLAVVALVASACGAAPEINVQEREVSTTSAEEPTTTAATSGNTSGVAADGDSVTVHYTGTLDDGSQFDSSAGRDPLAFVVGSGQVISGFDDAVRGLAVGESRTVRIDPANAYGDVDPTAIIEVAIADLPEGVTVGDQLVSQTGQTVTVVEMTDTAAMVDFNHPLAGQALTFDVELVSIG